MRPAYTRLPSPVASEAPPAPAPESGRDDDPHAHVFVTCADLTRLACDAWVVPPTATCTWMMAGAPRAFIDEPVPDDDWIRVWTNPDADVGEPREWLCALPGEPASSVDGLPYGW